MERLIHSSKRPDTELESSVFASTQITAQILAEIEELRSQLGCTSDLRTSPACLLGASNTARRRPLVVIVRREGTVVAAIFLFELVCSGFGTGLYLGGDLVSDGLMISDPNFRDEYLSVSLAALFKERFLAHSVRLCLAINKAAPALNGMPQYMALRRVQRRLVLAESFSKMLASFGAHTRRHLQRKRVLLEAKGMVRFSPSLSPSQAFRGMIALSHAASVPRSLSQHRARFSMLALEKQSFCMGLQIDGEWLSLISGWRVGSRTCIDLQMNNAHFKDDSISAVTRSYLMEHEIGLGQKELFFVGGSSVLLQRYCVPDEVCADIVVRRGQFRSRAVEWGAKLFAPQELVDYIYRFETLQSPEDASLASRPEHVPNATPELRNATPDQLRPTGKVGVFRGIELLRKAFTARHSRHPHVGSPESLLGARPRR